MLTKRLAALAGGLALLVVPGHAGGPAGESRPAGRPAAETAETERETLRGMPGSAEPPGGRLIRELGCGACHADLPAPDLVRRRAPTFGRDGRSYEPGFLLSYLRDPGRVRGDIGRSGMPDFHLSEAESLALSLYLLERAGRSTPAGRRFRAARRAHPDVDAALGRRIFRALNCAGCHRGTGVDRWKAGPRLGALESRARPGWLREWLTDPRALRPYGFRPGTGSRMPDFGLGPAEADTVAAYLLGTRPGDRPAEPDGNRPGRGPSPPELSAFERRKAEALLRDHLPCLGCHRLDGRGGRVGPALDGVAARRTSAYLPRILRRPGRAAPGGGMPRVPMTDERRRLLAGYLATLDSTRRGTSGRSGYLSLVEHPIRAPGEASTGGPGAPTRGEGPQGEELYVRRCAACHGADGSGDGYNAPYLPADPAAHASAASSRRTDDQLFDAIWSGGHALGRSHRMPPFGGSLSREQARSLVAHIRELCDCSPPEAFRPGPGDGARTGPPASRHTLYGRDGHGSDSASVEPRDFVGAAACAECHPGPYEKWTASTHGSAGGPPSEHTVIAPFGSDTIRFLDATVVPTVTDTGAYQFRVRWEGHGTRTLSVDAVVGKGHLEGGGNQGFLTRSPDGTLRFLPFDWRRTEARWFCTTVGRRDRGWVPTEQLELADCSDWPPSRVLGTVERYENCQECHGSQIRVDTRRGQPHFETRYRSLRIGCESCHGPGRRHVRLARSGRIDGRAGIRLPALDTLDAGASVGVCLRCHGLKTPLRGGYLPGRPLEDHYSLGLPLLGGRPYLPDGRIRTFGYQATHLSSRCYLSGSMTCTDCHSPHEGGYRDHFGRRVEGRLADGQCTSCHPSKAGRGLEAHTHHPASSRGSRCVSCHMPYLQQPRVGRRIRYARSDHSVPVPRPAFDDSLGVENACAKCHEDRSTASLQAAAERWWGALRPQDPLVRGILRADAVEDAGRAAELLLRPGERDPVAQLQGIRRLLDDHLRPGTDSLPAEARRRLLRLSRSPDLEVRAAALAAYHYAAGELPPGPGRSLAEQHAPVGPDSRRVLDRWAVALGFLADRHRRAGEHRAAISTYRKALTVRPDRADLRMGLGRAHAAAGAADSATAQYRRAADLDPDRALAHVNLGAVHAARGRSEAAREAYRTALEINPREPLAHARLGALHLNERRPRLAARAFRRALEADPGLAEAYFGHARALAATGRLRPALDTVRLGLEYRPDHRAGRRLLRELRSAAGGAGPPGDGGR